VEPAYVLAPVAERAAVNSPLLRLLFDHWLDVARGGIPPPSAIDLDHLEPVLPFHWWFSAQDGGADFMARRMGTETVRTYGIDFTGRSLLDAGRLTFAARAMLVLRAPMRERRPCRFFSETTVIPERIFYDIEALALPLSSDGETIDEVVGATVVRHL